MVRTDLTARELEILKLLSQRPTNKQVSHARGISNNTVRIHVLTSSKSWTFGLNRSCGNGNLARPPDIDP
jgi:FixJ family two-component response regulator